MCFIESKITANISTVALLATLMLAPKAHAEFCLFNCPDKKVAQTLHLNATETKEQSELAQQTLITLQDQMKSKFASVESQLQSGNSESALSEAKVILDTVRVKIGINPKVKLNESFLAPLMFPPSATLMEQLDSLQKEIVINTVSQFRGGIFMDLMNLYKRTSLLYLKAFKIEVQKLGGLTESDRNKILKDLATATLIPMTIEDKAGKVLIIFDEDVANEDHIYLFNRELKMWIIQEKDLGISEAEFNKYRQSVKESILKDVNSRPGSSASINNLLQKTKDCVDFVAEYQPTNRQDEADCVKRAIPQSDTAMSCAELINVLESYDFSNRWLDIELRPLCYDKFKQQHQ